MVTARGMYELATARASRCRRLAVRAARLLRRGLAIRLVAHAQALDDRASEWRAQVPKWQWEAY